MLQADNGETGSKKKLHLAKKPLLAPASARPKQSRPKKSVPGFIIRIVLGNLLYQTVTMNCRVSNAKAKKYLDWRPEYPTYREGLPVTVRKLEAGKRQG